MERTISIILNENLAYGDSQLEVILTTERDGEEVRWTFRPDQLSDAITYAREDAKACKARFCPTILIVEPEGAGIV